MMSENVCVFHIHAFHIVVHGMRSLCRIGIGPMYSVTRLIHFSVNVGGAGETDMFSIANADARRGRQGCGWLLAGVLGAAPVFGADVLVSGTVDAGSDADISPDPADSVTLDGGTINVLGTGFAAYTRATAVAGGGVFAVTDSAHTLGFGPLALSGSGPLTLAGPGRYRFAATTAGYHGTLTLAGTGGVSFDAALSHTRVALAGMQTLGNLVGSGEVSAGNGVVLDNTLDTTFAGDIELGANASLVKTGPGTFALQGRIGGGPVRVAAGSLSLDADGAVNAAASLRVDAGAQVITHFVTGALRNLTGAGNVDIGGSGVILWNPEDSTFDGTFSGFADYVAKAGTATLTLTGALPVTQFVLVADGTLRLTRDDVLLGNPGSLAVSYGATLDLGATRQTLRTISGGGRVLSDGELTFVHSERFPRLEAELAGSGSVVFATPQMRLMRPLGLTGSVRVASGSVEAVADDALAAASST